MLRIGKYLKATVLIGLLNSLAMTAEATVITFDEFGAAADFAGHRTLYDGFIFDRGNVIQEPPESSTGDEGLRYAAVSGERFLWANIYDLRISSSDPANKFTFVSAWFTATYADNVSVAVQGIGKNGGAVQFEEIITLSYATPTLFSFDFDNISEVYIFATNLSPDPAGDNTNDSAAFAIDDFAFTSESDAFFSGPAVQVPAPAQFSLLFTAIIVGLFYRNKPSGNRHWKL